MNKDHDWKCCGCGAWTVDRLRVCRCLTGSCFRIVKGAMETALQIDPPEKTFQTAFPFSEDECPAHVASANPKICANCGVHVDSFRLAEPECGNCGDTEGEHPAHTAGCKTFQPILPA